MLTHSEASPELVAEASGFSNREDWRCGFAEELCLTIVQAGDLARKKTCPALQCLFQHGFLPSNVAIIGEAENKQFLERCSYVADLYDGAEGRQCLAKVLDKRESKVK
ncbi:hypothetical protein D9Q98_000010 [Chlorella vulgaris]|uniref:Glucose-6-phosphate dehydrogenase NAD-binding domain-containing protein n=1 Tax=Chlorella vulgaris TaxID=3077 RepID=A0A9D4Z1F3_CHLVU|nr:hypothetical protein D9Q98_000010 [Chlorella vulgaris]